MTLTELVTGRAEDEDRRALDGLEEVIEEREEGRFGRVDVVDDHRQRSIPGQRLEQSSPAPQQLGHRELSR